MSTPWGEGTIIMGRYRLLSLLGAGGMGSVWKAEHVQLKNQMAVKLLDPAIAQNEEMLGRFLREARACATLKNRHIVQVFDHGVEDGTAFMVMELLHGETLGARIGKGSLSVEETVKYMCQVMRAIGRAHEAGVVHRDLKPDNIFLCDDEDEIYAKVLDFGVAKVSSSELEHSEGLKTQTGMMIGTPFYMSPEQAKAKAVDQRTDVWALAVITYECLTGKRPYTGDSFAELLMAICTAPTPLPSRLVAVPAGFDEWFVKGTQRDVDRRFRSTKEMADELMQLASAPILPRQGSTEFPAAARTATAARPTAPMPARDPKANRFNLTTGQSATTSLDSRLGERAANRSGLFAAALLGMLALGGGGTYLALRGSSSGEAKPTAAAEPGVDPAAAPLPAAPAPSPAAVPAPPEVTPEPLASAAPAAEPATTSPAAPSAETRPKTTAKPVKAGAKATTTEAPKSSTSGSSLPPEKWEF